MSFFLAQAVRFRDMSDLLEAACSTKYSSADSSLRWMILTSSVKLFPQALVSVVKEIECAYEVRTIESLSLWVEPYELPYSDYKVIAVEHHMEQLRQALEVHVSPLQH